MRYSLATSRNARLRPAGLPREGPQAARRESRLDDATAPSMQAPQARGAYYLDAANAAAAF
jgi:hypothetical protein